MNMKARNLITLCLLLCGTLLHAQETTWYNPMNEAVPVLHGQGWQQELKGSYSRIPDRLESQVSKSVWGLANNTAGEKIVFRTNSANIRIRYSNTSNSYAMRHMPATGMSGVDLYSVDEHGTWYTCNPNFHYVFADTCKYNYQELTYPKSCEEKGREYHLYLPLYNGVKWMEIGVDEGSFFRYELPSLEKPIVIYGTSIAQGACASRPGMAWTNIVERTLQHPILNLGFSGSAKMEPGMQQVLNELDASLFILDNMENMRAEDVYESSLQCCHLLRQNHPETPILLVEHSGQPDTAIREKAKDYQRNNEALRKVWTTLQEEHMTGLYYLTCEELGLDTESFVEGIHPNDWGMRQNAQGVIRKVKEIFQENHSARFTPVTQNRDPYMWRERHEQVLKLNAEEHPDVVLIGNSITHYFGGEPKAHIVRGQEAWESMTQGLKVHNLGFGWDRIENALWRIYHGELSGYQAKKVFLLIGTNNIPLNDTDEVIADGIMQVVQAVKDRQPEAQIYVCGIIPRHGWGDRVLGINTLLRMKLMAHPEVTYVSMEEMGDADGVLLEPYRHDGTHPNDKGYEAEAKILRKYMME